MSNTDSVKYEIIPDLLYHSSNQYPDASIIRKSQENETYEISYKRFTENVINLSNFIYANYAHNINIALVKDFDSAWLLWYFSILLSGNTVVTIDHGIAPEEICALVDKTDVSVVIADDRMWNEFSMQMCCAVINVDTFEAEYNDLKLSYDELKRESSAEKPAMIVFTSGTVGDSKGVILSHRNILMNVLYSVQIMGESTFRINDSIIPLLPPFHMLQITTGLLAPIWYGVTLCFINNFKQFKTGIIRFKPSIIIVVPTILEGFSKVILSQMKGIKYAGFLFGCWASKILRSIKIDARKFMFRRIHNSLGGNLRLIVCGGAFVEQKLLEWYDSIGITVLHGYGITECSPVVCCNQDGRAKPYSVGKNMPEFCMVKEHNGELLVKGDIVFRGYYKDPLATEEAFWGEWFRTGDTGYIDKDGYIFLSGRKKNIIVLKNGDNVSPEEIERGLEEYELIEGALVYMNARGDSLEADVYLSKDVSNQMPKAIIHEKLDDILRLMNGKLQKSKQLDSLHIVETPFERTALGKIKRIKYITEHGRKIV